jgi:hypothetical protein
MLFPGFTPDDIGKVGGGNSLFQSKDEPEGEGE